MRMQPTFRGELAQPYADAVAKLRAAVRTTDLGEHADAAGACLDFRVAPAECRVWSPHLSVQLYETPGGVEYFGRFSPRPTVWTFVMMVCFGAATAIIGGGVYGCAQWMLGVRPWGLAAIPAGALTIVGLYLVSATGQRWSSHQMAGLRERFDRVLVHAVQRPDVRSEAS
ncbi:MAG: hypothetical protein AAFV43_03930 [Planctomycetota bacterium]